MAEKVQRIRRVVKKLPFAERLTSAVQSEVGWNAVDRAVEQLTTRVNPAYLFKIGYLSAKSDNPYVQHAGLALLEHRKVIRHVILRDLRQVGKLADAFLANIPVEKKILDLDHESIQYRNFLRAVNGMVLVQEGAYYTSQDALGNACRQVFSDRLTFYHKAIIKDAVESGQMQDTATEKWQSLLGDVLLRSSYE